MRLIQEFKNFALKGNVVDMAVGVVVGGAFSKVVSSIVTDLITPVIGMLTAGVDFKDLKFVIGTTVAEDGSLVENAIAYGNFIQTLIDFFIIGFSILFVVKAINKAKDMAESRKKVEAAAAGAAEEKKAPTEAELLLEIRDLLAERRNSASENS